MKYCYSTSDVPKVKHYVILEFNSIFIPGDERSRTNPGHGYPEHTETTANYIVYTDKAEWEKEVVKRTERNQTAYSKTDFVALVVSPANIKVQVNVTVD